MRSLSEEEFKREMCTGRLFFWTFEDQGNGFEGMLEDKRSATLEGWRGMNREGWIQFMSPFRSLFRRIVPCAEAVSQNGRE